jgi:hypothetical protein
MEIKIKETIEKTVNVELPCYVKDVIFYYYITEKSTLRLRVMPLCEEYGIDWFGKTITNAFESPDAIAITKQEFNEVYEDLLTKLNIDVL